MGLTGETGNSGIQLAQEFLFIHVILEGFAAIDKDDWDFVVVQPQEFGVSIYIHLGPGETAVAGEFGQALLHHIAKMATLAGVDNDGVEGRHAIVF